MFIRNHSITNWVVPNIYIYIYLLVIASGHIAYLILSWFPSLLFKIYFVQDDFLKFNFYIGNLVAIFISFFIKKYTKIWFYRYLKLQKTSIWEHYVIYDIMLLISLIYSYFSSKYKDYNFLLCPSIKMFTSNWLHIYLYLYNPSIGDDFIR